MSFAESIEAEKTKIEQEAEAYKSKENLPGFWVAPVDEVSSFTVLEEEVRDKDFGQGVRKIFAITVKGERKDWALNPKNPLYGELVLKLADGDRVFDLLRVGEKAQTRYKLKDSKKLEKPEAAEVKATEVNPKEEGVPKSTEVNPVKEGKA